MADDNPYQAPQVEAASGNSALDVAVHKFRDWVTTMCLALGCYFFVFAHIATVMPTAESGSFTVISGLAAIGLLAVGPRRRWVALGLLVLSVCLAVNGYFRGLEYERQVRERGSDFQKKMLELP